MAVWSLIAVVVGVCWVGILILGWLLCRAAKRGDENGTDGRVIPLSPERLPSAAERR